MDCFLLLHKLTMASLTLAPCFTLCFLLCSTFSYSLNQEGVLLLKLKHSFSDPDSLLHSWYHNDENPCHWYGIKCDPVLHTVNSIDLSNSNIAGPFPSFLCRLHHLQFISFFNNSITSTLPVSMSKCKLLEHLDLALNYLTGTLPSKLGDLPNLKYLDLSGNNFSGHIPRSFGRFKKLEVISLVFNIFDGIVPPFLGNLSTLKMLNLSYNPFTAGPIPHELGNLTNLEVLWMTECNLVGEIPESLGRLSKLKDLDLALNNLAGKIPSSLAELTSIVQIELYSNSLTGELPRELGNLTTLRLLDASMNNLTGTIPDELCRLPLKSLNLYQNDFVGTLPASIGNSTNLYELRLFQNQLTGELPQNLGKNSALRWIDVSKNQFTGEIPSTLCFGGELEKLLMIYNSLSGQIPTSLIQCRTLTRIRLSNNKFAGHIPAGFWGLPSINFLDLADNSFSGPISESIINGSDLAHIKISRNNFNGEIPKDVGFLSNLVEFSASNNKLSGSLPVSMIKLSKLGIVDLHNNFLSGVLPDGIGSWKSLIELNLANNTFSGEIPGEIGTMYVLNHLDLSENQFSGKIPLSLQNLKLNELNFSNNRLSGEIPPFFMKDIYKYSFLGNPNLCIHVICDGGRENKSNINDKAYSWLLRSILILFGLIFGVGIIWFLFNLKKSRVVESKWAITSFHKRDFSEREIVENLDEDNVIGEGASGKVYKIVLNNGEVVAVKKLRGETQKKDDLFDAEVMTLGKIRHKNIVKLWCSCSNRVNNHHLLVYEYMENGSLGDLLHDASEKGLVMNWAMRCKVMVEAAAGLSYLHHDCVPPILHRDIKSNNILLDKDFSSRIADFGVAKTVDLRSAWPKSMSIIAGSCGYIAPEYAYTLHVTEKSDVYSFGVVILELVTGKRPDDEEIGEKDLVSWVAEKLEERELENVIDPKLDSCFKEEMWKVVNIGLLCTNSHPINRPSMRRVVKLLQDVGGGGGESKLQVKVTADTINAVRNNSN